MLNNSHDLNLKEIIFQTLTTKYNSRHDCPAVASLIVKDESLQHALFFYLKTLTNMQIIIL